MIKVMIVDDERLARVELKRLLSAFDDIEVVAEAKDAEQAMQRLKQGDIDLAFLDIQMPEVSGLELAEQIGPQTLFVFCTAFSEHALDAFGLNAADYLVKPVNPERLSQALGKVRQLLKHADKTTDAQPLNYLADNHGLLLKFGQSSKIVRLNEVERFESVGNHAALYTNSGKAFIHSSLSKIEKRLDPAVFFKASRSDIIRIDSIKEIQDALSPGCLLAIMQSGAEIEVSRRQAAALKQLFNVW